MRYLQERYLIILWKIHLLAAHRGGLYRKQCINGVKEARKWREDGMVILRRSRRYPPGCRDSSTESANQQHNQLYTWIT